MHAQGVIGREERAASLLDLVLGIWREVLDFAGADLAANSNFFLSGGDSLHLMRVLVRVRERIGVDLPLRDAARFTTPARMAHCCAAALRRQGVVRPGSASQITANTVAHNDPPAGHGAPGIAPADAERFACTAGQTALWLAEQCGEAAGLYNTALIVHFNGVLEVPLLARALERLLERHEVLRATLRFDTRERRLYATIHEAAELKLEPQAMAPNSARRFLQMEAELPVDFAAGPLCRFRLVITGPGTWWLLICVHHCVTDGWSGGVLLRHLAQLYNASLGQPGGPRFERDTAFRRFSAGQEQLPQAELDWWRAKLAGADGLRSWPPTGNQRWPFAMARDEQLLDLHMLESLHAVRRIAKAELSACLLAALRLAVYSLTGIDELCIGMPVSLRNSSEQEDAVGYFVNLVVLRDRSGGEAEHFRDRVERFTERPQRIVILKQMQRSLAEALLHRTAPLPELARQLRPQLLPSGNPWCDLVFAYHNLPWELPRFSGADATLEAVTLASQYPLKVEFVPDGGKLICCVEYARALLTERDARALQAAIRHQLAWLGGAARSS